MQYIGGNNNNFIRIIIFNYGKNQFQIIKTQIKDI